LVTDPDATLPVWAVIVNDPYCISGPRLDVNAPISGSPTPAEYEIILKASNGTVEEDVTVSTKLLIGDTLPAFNLVAPAGGYVAEFEELFELPLLVTGSPKPTCSATGLPEGLAVLNTGSDCVIRGVPTLAGKYMNIVLTASNGEGTATMVIGITVEGQAPKFHLYNETAYIVKGDQTHIGLGITGSPCPTVAENGLPAGLKITGTCPTPEELEAGGDLLQHNFAISGIVTAAFGAYPVTLRAANGLNSGHIVFQQLIINVVPSHPTFHSKQMHSVTAGKFTSIDVKLLGNPYPSLAADALPAGLALVRRVPSLGNPLTPVGEARWYIEGTPTAAIGTYTVNLHAENPGDTADHQLTINVAGTDPAFHAVSHIQGYTGEYLHIDLGVTGSPAPVVTLQDGTALPAGVSLVQNESGGWELRGYLEDDEGTFEPQLVASAPTLLGAGTASLSSGASRTDLYANPTAAGARPLAGTPAPQTHNLAIEVIGAAPDFSLQDEYTVNRLNYFETDLDIIGSPRPTATVLSGELPDGIELTQSGALTLAGDILAEPGVYVASILLENSVGSLEKDVKFTVLEAGELPPKPVPSGALTPTGADPRALLIFVILLLTTAATVRRRKRDETP
jgi:PKD repeat protein